MSNRPRLLIEGATYHCYSRCRGKRNLLKSRFGGKCLVEAIKMCQEKYNFQLIAAEPVGNHIHLIICTIENEQNISRIMQYIKARVAEKYNRSMGETGPFWNERFGATIIEESPDAREYLLWLLWYIGYNPVKKGLSPDPRKNFIGFINKYLSHNCEIALNITLHQFFLDLGDSFEQCVKKFLLYEEAYLKRVALYF